MQHQFLLWFKGTGHSDCFIIEQIPKHLNYLPASMFAAETIFHYSVSGISLYFLFALGALCPFGQLPVLVSPVLFVVLGFFLFFVCIPFSTFYFASFIQPLNTFF